jgi:excisionase family DNA binding protein
MSNMSGEPLWKTADVARCLNVSERSVRRYVALGLLRGIRVGGLIRFEPTAVEALLKAGATDVVEAR